VKASRLRRANSEVDHVGYSSGNPDLFGPYPGESGIPQRILEGGGGLRGPHGEDSAPLQHVMAGGKSGWRVEVFVVVGDGPVRPIVNVQTKSVVTVRGGAEMADEVRVQDHAARIGECSAGDGGERSLAVPVDDRLLALDDGDDSPVRVGGGVGEGEADAEAADEQGRGRTPGERVEGRVDEQALRAAVGGVHQEAPVGDDLVVHAALPQDDLSIGSLAPVEGDGRVGVNDGSVGVNMDGQGDDLRAAGGCLTRAESFWREGRTGTNGFVRGAFP
jgi:hypothetical protein